MITYGGSEFDEKDFLLFGERIKEFTYNTYLEIALEGDESPGYRENVKEELRKYKLHIKEELLDSYMKKSKFNELNDMVVKAANDEGYQEVAHSGSDELYDFTGLTEKILKKIGINYVLTQDDLDSIRSLLESSSSRGSTKKKKKKKPTKKKKKATKKKPTKKKPTKKKKKPNKGKKLLRRSIRRKRVIKGSGPRVPSADPIPDSTNLEQGNIAVTTAPAVEDTRIGDRLTRVRDEFVDYAKAAGNLIPIGKIMPRSPSKIVQQAAESSTESMTKQAEDMKNDFLEYYEDTLISLGETGRKKKQREKKS